VHGWLFNLPKISQEKPNAIMTDNQLADKVISGEFLALLLDLLFCWEEKTKNVKPDTRCIFRSSSRDGRNKEGGHLPLASSVG